MQEEIFKVHGTDHLQYKQKRLYASFVYIYMFFILPSDNARYIFRSPPLLHIIRPLSHISFLYSANCLKIPLSNNCLLLSKLPCKLLLLSFYLSSLYYTYLSKLVCSISSVKYSTFSMRLCIKQYIS